MGPQILAAINSSRPTSGRLRRDYARASGWMQFMPSTWDMYATDGDGDGKTDPTTRMMRSFAAARYLGRRARRATGTTRFTPTTTPTGTSRDGSTRARHGALGDTIDAEEEHRNLFCRALRGPGLEILNY